MYEGALYRAALQAIRERFPELWVEPPHKGLEHIGLNGGLLQCFDPVLGEDNRFPGEDVAFCRRWVDGCGGEIWANVDKIIVHIGSENYVGQYLYKLQHR